MLQSKAMKSAGLCAFALLCSTFANAEVKISKSGGWNESAYVEWTNESQYSDYNVYYRSGSGEYKALDKALVRNYGTYGRADALGLSAGNYQLKVVPVKNGSEASGDASETSDLTVLAHDRSGFAFSGSHTPGAYNANGTLKSNTLVIYLTESNKDKISASITTSNKGTTTSCTGITEILTAIKKGYETRPVDIRVVGNVTASGQIASNSSFKGDIMIDLNSSDCQLTIEGVGIDATANGWGVRLKNSNYVEVRNLGFMNCNSDEGDNVGLQQGNNYIWVHHCDMFYGDAGSDADQVKGDGALDCKKSNYITFSYNHFVDNGKCNLLGLSEGVKSYESNAYYITYHHNWYDHSDSRHPRCRYYNAHVYNNYYDGCAKYGAGSTLGSSVYMQNNYFRNTKYPMMTSMQGTDLYASGSSRNKANGTFSNEDGGTIKAHGNIMTGSYYFIPYNAATIYTAGKEEAATVRGIDTSKDFDAIVVDDPSKEISSSITSYQGANYYSNFDIKRDEAKNANVDAAEDVVSVVTGEYGAGRMSHGDFTWTFNNSVDDGKYAVDTELKSKLTNYKTTLKGYYGEVTDTSTGGDSSTDTGDNGSTEGGDKGDTSTDGGSTNPVVPTDGNMVCHFTGGAPSNTTFYTFTNANYSDSKGTATVNGTQYSYGMKLESATSVAFTTTESGTLTLVFGSTETPSVKIDGKKLSELGSVVQISGNVATITLDKGSHTITKENSANIYYMAVAYAGKSAVQIINSKEMLQEPIFDLFGRKHSLNSIQPMRVYISNGKRFIYVEE